MALPTSVIDDLVADSRRFYTAEAKPSPQPVRGTEWVDRLLQQYRHCRDAHPSLGKISSLRRCDYGGLIRDQLGLAEALGIALPAHSGLI
jgi:hypothetical protein